MKLNEAFISDCFANEKQLREDNYRNKLLKENEDHLLEIQRELYYNYDVKDYYVVNEFISKSNYFPDTIDLYFSLSKEDFEDLADSEILNEYSTINFYCSVEGKTYFFEDKYWKLSEDIKRKVYIQL